MGGAAILLAALDCRANGAFTDRQRDWAHGKWGYSIALWEPNGTKRHRFENLTNQVTTLTFSRDSQNLLFTRGSIDKTDKTATVINVQTGSVVSKFNQHSDNVYAGTLSPDGTYAATAGSRQAARTRGNGRQRRIGARAARHDVA